MSSKSSPRSRKTKQKEDKYETLVQVHKILKSDVSSEKDNTSRTDNSEDGESNKAFHMDDYNENRRPTTNHAPSREISIDGETQINTKILSLIETEMKRDINKHSHFTESRPQSLSFYEDEKIPEELSGNLELLSPEERRHYRRRKEHNQADSDERRAYAAIQDLYNSRDDEAATTKKSKRKKRHVESEAGIGDSREMMIPKEKKKSKKKKRESGSPMTGKRKHKRRDEDQESKNEVTIALEELQDDVFEKPHEEHKGRKPKDVPELGDRLYVQKRNKFEIASRPSSRSMYVDPNKESEEQAMRSPLNVAMTVQKSCTKIFLPCHGLLAGLAFGQWLYLTCNSDDQSEEFFMFYSHFNDFYITSFYFLITICLVSSFDRMDVAHILRSHIVTLSTSCKIAGFLVIIFYIIGLILHLSVCNIENRLGEQREDNATISYLNITTNEIVRWNQVSLWRFVFVLLPWLLVAATASDDNNLLYLRLRSISEETMGRFTGR